MSDDLSNLTDEQLKAAIYAAKQKDGFSPRALINKLPAVVAATEPGNSVSGTLNALGSGAIWKGVPNLMGLPGDLRELVKSGVNWAVPPPKGVPQYEPRSPFPTSEQVRQQFSNVLGPAYEPKTRLERYAETVGEFAPAGVAFGGAATPASMAARGAINAGKRFLGTTVSPALGSEFAGQAVENTKLAPYSGTARVLGALASPAIAGGFKTAVRPSPVSQPRSDAMGLFQKEGIPFTAGQASGSKALQYTESTLGDYPGAGSKASAAQGKQSEKFTQAVLKRAGINAQRGTPQVIDEAFTNVGQRFDDLAARNQVRMDRKLTDDLTSVMQEYAKITPQPSAAVQQQIQAITDRFKQTGGVLTGEAYKSFRSELGRIARGSKSSPELSRAWYGVQNALDDAAERSIAAANPSDLGAWRAVRGDYRNLLAIERVLTMGGQGAAEGMISPQQMRSVLVGQNRRDYARGSGDFADLTRAGNILMAPLPQSGTTPRAVAVGIPSAIGGVAGGMFGPSMGTGPTVGGILGASLAAGMPALAGRAVMSETVQNMLKNQMLRQPGDVRRSLVQQLMMLEPRTVHQFQE